MKRTILLLACLIPATLMTAQNDDSKVNFSLEMSNGIAKTFNYSPISLFDDATDSYTTSSFEIYAGVNLLSQGFGIKFDASSGNTIQLFDETYSYMNILFAWRFFAPLTSNIDIWGSINPGLGLLMNDYTASGEEKDVTRAFLAYDFEGGLNYNITDAFYIGVKAGFFGGVLKKHDYEVPTGAIKNNHDNLAGSMLMLTLGVKL